jgi:CheY-like chemotaxis protein
MLTGLGFCVTQASCAEQALRLLEQGLCVDLLVTDHSISGMNGTDLCSEVLRRVPGMQVPVISGFAKTNAIPPSFPMLVKPLRSADLSQRLAHLGIGPGEARP